jgi:hypothetical protein
MTPGGRSRILLPIAMVLLSFGACRDFGGASLHDDAMGGDGGTPGTGGTAGASGTGGNSGSAGSESGGNSSGGGSAGDGGRGGDGGGQAGSEGGAGADGGAAGDGGTGGSGSECRLDQTVIPECFSYPPMDSQAPTIQFGLARAVTITATEDYDDRFRIIATQTGSSTLATVHTTNTTHESWFGWFCFDAVPNPVRLAATTLANDAQEIFAISECGRVYVRRFLFVSADTEGWSPWVPLDLPASDSLVTDAAIARQAGSNDLFVVDRGNVFAARKAEDVYGPYGHWARVAEGAGELLAAGMHADGTYQQLFTIDGRGRLMTSIRATEDPAAPFDHWTDFGLDREIVDFDAPYGVGAPLIVVALDVDGLLWTREEEGAGEFGDWEQLVTTGEPTEELVSIAGASFPARQDQALMLVTVGVSGAVYSVRRASGAWEGWWDVTCCERP